MRFLKWIALALVIIVAGLVIARTLFAERIGEAAFKRVVGKTLNTNPLADLDDGLHIILLGTGSPLPDPVRAGPSTAIVAGNTLYIVDSGAGSVRNIGQYRLPIAKLDGVFLTHLHSDHIDGLGELALQHWAGGGAKKPLRLYGPEGTQKVAMGLERAYEADSYFRVVHHGQEVVPQQGFGLVASTLKLGDETSGPALVNDTGLTVTVFKVEHDPVTPAFGYRFDYKGRSVTLSGDTAYTPTIGEIGQGSDILIHEALNAEMVGVIENELTAAGNARLAKIMKDIPDYHATPVQAAQSAEEAGADMLVISHIVPAVPSEALYPYFLKGTDEAYGGKIVMGEDGMLFSLPANSDKIIRKRLD